MDINFPSRIAGILKLSSPYKFKATHQKTEAFLFEPLDNLLPNFIVQSTIGQSSSIDHAVIIEPMANKSDLELPRGSIISILGNVINEGVIQKLHLYNKNIFPKTIKIDSKNIKSILENELTINFPLEIFSIDPTGCKDIDDAFSYQLTETHIKLYIHISNVSYSLQQLGILNDVLEKSVTSIYPPNSEPINMLASILSTNYLSLLEKSVRPLLTLEISYHFEDKSWDYKFYQSIGKITRNYSYEHYPKRFNELFPICTSIYQEITGNLLEINNSHKLIEGFMLIYNYLASKELLIANTGIFRIQSEIDRKFPTIIQPELQDFLSILNSNSASYSIINSSHSSLSLQSYCHITSPIRRVVDIYNQTCLLQKLNGYNIFNYNLDLEKINETNKLLKRLYKDFESYSLALKLYYEELETKTYCGYIYDIYNEIINIYIPELKLAISYRLFDYDLDAIYEVRQKENTIEIYNKQKDTIEWSLEIFKKYNMTIYGKPNYKRLNRSILIDILYE